MPEPEPRLLIAQRQPAPGVVVVALSGELDAATSVELRETVVRLAARPAPPTRLLLELSGVTYCDNASLYTLLGICQALEPVGTAVTLTSAGAAVVESIRRNTLEEHLPIETTLRAYRP